MAKGFVAGNVALAAGFEAVRASAGVDARLSAADARRRLRIMTFPKSGLNIRSLAQNALSQV
ncbi:MAG: hypothetical protein ABIO68_00840 [Sphingomicrobium sp.]